MKYLLILSLVLTMTSVIGSNIEVTEPTTTASATAVCKKLQFNLSVNENVVRKEGDFRPALFFITVDENLDNEQIALLVRRTLSSMFNLDDASIESIICVFIGSPETNLRKHVQSPDDNQGMSKFLIPMFQIVTTQYSKRTIDKGRRIHWGPFFIRPTDANGIFQLYQK